MLNVNLNRCVKCYLKQYDHKVHNLAGKLPQEAGAKLPAIKQLTGFKHENMSKNKCMFSCEHEAGSFIYIIYFSIELKTGLYKTRSVLSAKGN